MVPLDDEIDMLINGYNSDFSEDGYIANVNFDLDGFMDGVSLSPHVLQKTQKKTKARIHA